ncbi:class I SAM-dependent methyltransferase [Thiohalophilus thiocyanatoxydans]|uniref:Methyltransferase family protein n=1 Tax=Thiohalophilus thiocyanatoxydans TaxID=381308 RepID=A0A4R8ISG2_9GAMM|nr:class I SAM-dependent methyltransferase [Thiohalophilus thiocyanatoxydans]TDY00577.1 methyltransferase family protein [Thiohalophilus thiocyanatoxydans]
MDIAEQLSIEEQGLKQQLHDTWCAGNYSSVARTLEPSALQFLARHPVRAGAMVLDVACGSGQVALPAARAGAKVWGIDIAGNLIEEARGHAEQEGLAARFEVGDAESLPYGDNSFDQIYSVIGAMFAPRPERVVAELTRVCRPGGEIVMANWTPEGFVGHFFKTVARHVPPPPMPSPLMWGTESRVRERFAERPVDLHFDRQLFEFRYPYTPEEVVGFYRQNFGPVVRAFAALDAAGQAALHADLVQLWRDYNLADDGTTHTQGEVLEIVAVPQ